MRFRNVEHVRLKESDRVVSMLQLNRMGGDVEVVDGELVVRGVERLAARRPALLLQRPPRPHVADRRRLAGRGRELADLPQRLPDLLSQLPRRHARDRARPRGRGRPRAAEGGAAVASGSGQRAHESVAIDQAAELPIVDWVGRWVARAARRGRAGRRAGAAAPGPGPGPSSRPRPTGRRRCCSSSACEPGETVAYQLPNWGEFVVLTLAAMKIGAVCCPLMPIFREREISQMLAPRRGAGAGRSPTASATASTWPRRRRCWRGDGPNGASTCSALEHVLVVGGDGRRRRRPDAARGRDRRRPVARLRRGARRPAARPRRDRRPHAGARRRSPSSSSPPAPSGEPKGVLHRYDALTRAAMMEVEHLGLGRDDAMFIPTPLAHQTGFLYGMWLAFCLGSRRSSRTSGSRCAAPARCASGRAPSSRRRRRSSPTWCGRSRRARRRRRRCGSSSSPAPRCRGRSPSARPDARRRGLRRLGHDRVLPRRARRPRRRPGEGLGHRRAGAGRHPDPDHRRRGPRRSPRRRGQLRGDQPLPLRRLPRPSRPDRRGDDRGRLVPHRRPGDDRRRRLPADHRPGQGRRQPRRREGAGGRDRAAAARAPAGRGRGDRGDARRAARRARLRLRRAERRRGRARPRRDARASSTGARSPATTGPSGSSRSTSCRAPPVARSRSSSCASAPASCAPETAPSPDGQKETVS